MRNCYIKATLAGVAQLVERQLPKLNVEGSNPFSRSKLNSLKGSAFFDLEKGSLCKKQ